MCILWGRSWAVFSEGADGCTLRVSAPLEKEKNSCANLKMGTGTTGDWFAKEKLAELRGGSFWNWGWRRRWRRARGKWSGRQIRSPRCRAGLWDARAKKFRWWGWVVITSAAKRTSRRASGSFERLWIAGSIFWTTAGITTAARAKSAWARRCATDTGSARL